MLYFALFFPLKKTILRDEGSEEMVLVPGPPTKPISSLFPSNKGNILMQGFNFLFSFKIMLWVK